MKKEDLEIKNKEENTAFILAAMLGNIEVVLLMLKKNEELVMIRNRGGILPVQMAASLGLAEMVKCLYNPIKDYLNDEDRILLLLTLIDNDIYDVARSMVEKFPSLAVSREKKTDGNGETALHAFARKPLTTLNEIGNSKQEILKRFYYPFINSNKVEKKKMHPKALELVKLLWEKIVNQQDYKQISDLITKPSTIVSDAAKQGNIDFLSFLIKEHPALIFKVDDNGYTLFHTAVEYRHKNIFNLINKTSFKDVIVAKKVGKGKEENNTILHLAAKLPPDQNRLKVVSAAATENNNILHLAAKLPPDQILLKVVSGAAKEKNTILHLAAKLPPDQNRLNVVSGAALQMQRELWWFKEVRKLMPPSIAGAKNGQGETAQTLFTESHKDLMERGEKWMKTTANSCMIVATLIATIVFAAAFTVPGGIKDDTGAPHFLRKASFKWFAIFDIISLVSSSCSILSFLSILTARYAEEDFGLSLSIKLLLGLVTLFISIIAMMVVFCTTLFIIFDGGTKVLAFLAISLAFIPVITFIWQQLRLFCDLVRTFKEN